MFAGRTGGAVADRPTPSQGLDSPENAPPEILAGRYVLEREIGRGATATVYLARDQRYNQDYRQTNWFHKRSHHIEK